MRCNEVNTSGFSLVELLVAMVIISIGVFAWIKTQDFSIRGRAISSGITTASELTMAQMERLSMECKQWPSSHANVVAANSTETIQGVDYSITSNITSGSVFPDGSAVWNVDIQVNWNHFRPQTVRYQRVVIGR